MNSTLVRPGCIAIEIEVQPHDPLQVGLVYAPQVIADGSINWFPTQAMIDALHGLQDELAGGEKYVAVVKCIDVPGGAKRVEVVELVPLASAEALAALP